MLVSCRKEGIAPNDQQPQELRRWLLTVAFSAPPFFTADYPALFYSITPHIKVSQIGA